MKHLYNLLGIIFTLLALLSMFTGGTWENTLFGAIIGALFFDKAHIEEIYNKLKGGEK